MNCKKSALSYWCFPRLVKVTSNSFYFYLVAFYFWIFMNMLQVGYCSDAPVADCALLVYHWSWRSGQHPKVLVPSLNFPWPTKCLHIVINYVQEPDTCYQQGLAARRLRRRLRAQVQHPIHTWYVMRTNHRFPEFHLIIDSCSKGWCKTFKRCCVNSPCGKDWAFRTDEDLVLGRFPNPVKPKWKYRKSSFIVLYVASGGISFMGNLTSLE